MAHIVACFGCGHLGTQGLKSWTFQSPSDLNKARLHASSRLGEAPCVYLDLSLTASLKAGLDLELVSLFDSLARFCP